MRCQRFVRKRSPRAAQSIRLPRVAGLLLLALLAVAPPLVAQSITGVVLEDSTDAPVVAAEVVLLASGARLKSIRTDDAGRFLIGLPPAGDYTVVTRRIGYVPTEWALRIDGPEDLRVQIRLTRSPPILPAATVTAHPSERRILLDGFEHRRRLGLGVFFTRDDLERRGRPQLTDLLRGIPGVNVISTRGSAATMSRSSYMRRCFAVLYMDGVRMNRSDDSPEVVRAVYEGIPARTLEAVEIYKGRSQMPAEFGGPEARCGVVAIWTIHPDYQPRSPKGRQATTVPRESPPALPLPPA